MEEGRSLAGVRWATVFVHGYNNSREQARKKWDITRRRLPGVLSEGPLIEYYWPGDPGWGPSYLKSVRYAKAVAIGRECGRQLGIYLSHSGLDEVSLVGHSLGCRVVLETLRHFQVTRARTRCRVALLLAAAVAEGLCDEPNRFTRPASLPDYADSLRVLYSHQDMVLLLGFPLGQRAAEMIYSDWSPAPGLARAVGRGGGPWGPPVRWKPRPVQVGLGHGKYWIDEDVVADHIAGVFSPSAAQYRAPTHHMPVREPYGTWDDV